MAGIIIVRLGQTPSRLPTMTWPTGRPNDDQAFAADCGNTQIGQLRVPPQATVSSHLSVPIGGSRSPPGRGQ
jgi:hypothetical protein